MQRLNFRLPRLGGAESEARVLAWKKSPGEPFTAGDTLLEVETDKAVVDVPAPAAGVLVRQLVAVDALAEFDAALAEIELADADAAAYRSAAGEGGERPVDAPAAAQTEAPAPLPRAGSVVVAGRVIATPVARRLAAEAGLALAAIPGSGPGGRIVRDDVRRLTAGARPAAVAPAAPQDLHFALRDGTVFVRRWNTPPAGQARLTTVLLHGLFGDVDTWSGLASSLAERGHALLALDLPAHGRTTTSGRSLDDLTRVVAQVLAELAPGPKLLVGHSLGGALAVKLAGLPELRGLQALALIAPAGFGTEINQGFLQGMLHAGTPALFRRELEKLARRLPAFGDALVAQLHAGTRSRADALAAVIEGFAVQGVQQLDLRAALEALPVPVSVLWGRLDQVIPWSHALQLTPRAALHLFPDAGHMPQWECSSLVAEVLDRLAEVAGQRGA